MPARDVFPGEIPPSSFADFRGVLLQTVAYMRDYEIGERSADTHFVYIQNWTDRLRYEGQQELAALGRVAWRIDMTGPLVMDDTSDDPRNWEALSSDSVDTGERLDQQVEAARARWHQRFVRFEAGEDDALQPSSTVPVDRTITMRILDQREGKGDSVYEFMTTSRQPHTGSASVESQIFLSREPREYLPRQARTIDEGRKIDRLPFPDEFAIDARDAERWAATPNSKLSTICLKGIQLVIEDLAIGEATDTLTFLDRIHDNIARVPVIRVQLF